MTLNATETTFLTAAFTSLLICLTMQIGVLLLAFCEAHNVKGLILLAREGINSTIAGVPEDVHAVLAYLRQDPKLADLEHKESVSNKAPFHRMKVRLKKKLSRWVSMASARPSEWASTSNQKIGTILFLHQMWW